MSNKSEEKNPDEVSGIGVEDPDDRLPVDKGWAWAICLAGFIVQVVMGSGGQTMAVLFVEILDKYESSILMGSVFFMCNILAFSFSASISGTVIVPKLKEKKTLLLGGILCTASSLGQGYSPNMGVFIVTSALKGFSVGLNLVPSVSLIGYYFKKRRSIASVIVMCGGSVAGIVSPFVIRATRKEYGITGAFVLLGAVELHLCLAGLLMRPLRAYRNQNEESDIESSASIENIPTNGTVKEAASSHTELNHNDKEPEFRHTLLKRSKSTEPESNSLHNSLPNSLPNSLIMDFLKPERDIVSATIREEHKSASLFYGSALTLASEPGFPAVGVLIENSPGSEEDGQKLGRWKQFLRDSSLGSCTFIMLIIAALPGSANQYLYSYMPAITNHQGANLDQSALLMTIMCTVDVASRLVMGFIADTKVLPPSRLLAASLVVLGATCQFFRFATDFSTLVIMVIVVGLVVGSRVSLLPLICIEVVGVDKMARAYSLICTVTTLAIAAWNPALGAIAESTGSFVTVMHVAGVGFVVGAILFGTIDCFVQRDLKRHGR